MLKWRWKFASARTGMWVMHCLIIWVFYGDLRLDWFLDLLLSAAPVESHVGAVVVCVVCDVHAVRISALFIADNLHLGLSERVCDTCFAAWNLHIRRLFSLCELSVLLIMFCRISCPRTRDWRSMTLGSVQLGATSKRFLGVTVTVEKWRYEAIYNL